MQTRAFCTFLSSQPQPVIGLETQRLRQVSKLIGKLCIVEFLARMPLAWLLRTYKPTKLRAKRRLRMLSAKAHFHLHISREVDDTRKFFAAVACERFQMSPLGSISVYALSLVLYPWSWSITPCATHFLNIHRWLRLAVLLITFLHNRDPCRPSKSGIFEYSVEPQCGLLWGERRVRSTSPGPSGAFLWHHRGKRHQTSRLHALFSSFLQKILVTHPHPTGR